MIPGEVGEALQNAEARYCGTKGRRQCRAWRVSERKWPLSWALGDEKRGKRGGGRTEKLVQVLTVCFLIESLIFVMDLIFI